MRRLLQFLLLAIFIAASTTSAHATTDCEKWFIAYKQQLEHTKSVQRVEAARRRARAYAKRKLAGYVKPKPVAHPRPRVARRRPMSPEETLRHFNMACGVLPEESKDQPLVSEETPPEFAPHLKDFMPTDPEGDGTPIASYVPPPYVPPGFGPPPESGPPIYYPPGGGTGGNTSPGPPGPPVPPAVPEPGTFVLMLTGLAGAAGAAKRRFRK